MNYPIPFFYPYHNPSNKDTNDIKLLEEKIDYLEKRIHILENVILKNENNNKTNYPEEPTDMYMI